MASTDLPTGTVTFLFTDVEGSTRLLQELGDRYAEVLAEHRRAVREAFARHGGIEVDTQGDAFFVAFAKASDALAAAAEARDALAQGPMNVRIGLHTGEPLVTDEGYVGIDVHRAARIAAAGHGGQILVSQSTRDLVGVDSLRDLGEHRLKDLTAPERIYQLGEGDFPRLKSLNATNLPLAANPLLGRERELAELQELLCDSARLVTITGPGGTGKTRLALQIAAEILDDFPDGVFWVSLAPLRDPALVPGAIAKSLGLPDEALTAGVKLAEFVRSRELLLVLDNAEHLPESAPSLGALLSDAPRLRVVVTSRSALHLTLEREYPLEPLTTTAAVALFVTRARSVRRDFTPDASVAQICRRLDGLPLALELAAARAKMLSASAILERLEQRLPLLTGGPQDAPERHQTLRATVDWSYELLEDREQHVFRGFSVFVGSADIEAAELVCDARLDDLASLVDKSLLKPTGDDRFFMLETIREYAAERLEQCGELEALERHHARSYLELAERISPEFWHSGHARWLERFAADSGNLHAAIDWFMRRGDVEGAARLAGALWVFWVPTGYIGEGLRVMAETLRHERELPPEVLAPVLQGAGHLSWVHGRLEDAAVLEERAVEMLRDLGDREKLAWAYLSLSAIAAVVRDFARAEAMSTEALALFREVGSDRGVAYGLNDLGLMALDRQDLDRAKKLLEDSVDLAMSAGDAYGVANARAGLAGAALESGAVEEAELLYGAALEDFERIASRSGRVECLEGLAAAAAVRGDAERAARLAGAGAAIRESIGLRTLGLSLPGYSGRLERARARIGDDGWRAAWDEGRAKTAEEIVAYARCRDA